MTYGYPMTTIRSFILALALTAAIATPAHAAERPTTPPATYYGMHYGAVSEGTWPDAKVGAIRLWDTGTSWAQIQPAPGTWDWTRLDAAVANATAHGADITLVLGMSPHWAAAPGNNYADGWSSMPNPDAWWVYVHTVAARYAGRIGSYEMWNEANFPWFWTGTPAQMATLARIARAAVRSADQAALLISPSVVLRGPWRAWVTAYRAAGGYRWADVVGVHGYPVDGLVRGAMANYDAVRAMTPRKPMWDTETNLETNTGRYLGTEHHQAVLLARYYRQAWAHGVRRVYWYDWSDTDNIGVRVATDAGAPSEAGRAFTAIQGN